MILKFIKFSFNVLLITLIMVIGFEFSGALAQDGDLEKGGSGLNIPQGEVQINSDIDKRPLGDVILSMVNYFIGFLGFVAVIMFVYAGVLWVVGGADDDQISKAKNIMTYAALGIVIVILSFSIVRFITSSAGGGETCTVDADCGKNGICNEQNFCELQAEGGNVCNSTADCSQGLSCTNGVCKLPLGGVCLTSKDCGAGQYCSNQLSCKDGGSVLCKVDSDCDSPPETCDAFGFCHNSDGVSDIQCTGNNNCATGYVCNLDKNKCEIQGANGKGGIQGGENEGLTLDALKKMDDSLGKMNENLNGLGDSIKNINLSPELKQALEEILAKTDLKGKIQDLKAFMEGKGPFDATTQTALRQLISGLEGLLLTEGQLAELKSLMPESAKTKAALEEASKALTELEKEPMSNLKLKQFESRYKALKDIILSFPVVKSQIKVSPGQGNAPLQVVFDGLDSFDPSGGTISSYNWSFLDSQGKPQSLGNSPVVTHEFKEPGTYNIRLQVATSNLDKEGFKVAMDGISNVIVKVSPPASKIAFRINNIEAKDVHNITEEEAKAGINFDPSITSPGLGKTIKKYEWFYGDTFSDVVSEPVTVIHNFPKPGEYQVTLKVTDNQGVTDKRVVKLVIKPLAADIEGDPKLGDVNTEFRFKGGKSRSDKGYISDYQWKVYDKDNALVIENNEENFNHTFEQPGVYKIELIITDSVGAQDKAIQQFEVLSRDPVANFSYKVLRPNQSNILEFDASESYDPDKGDKITYSWDFDGDGQFEIVDSEEKKISYTYRRAGAYKAILQVQDDFGRRHQIQKEIKIESILGAEIQSDKKAAKVQEVINFKAVDSTAVAYLWDFGDGETQTTEETEVTHAYKKGGKYLVKLNFFDRDDNTNTDTYYVLIAQGDAPIALAETTMSGTPLSLTEDLCGAGFHGYTVRRSDNISFSAANSLNRDGSGRLLSYDWRFSDGIRNNKKEFIQRFTDLTPEGGCVSASLMVRDEVSGTMSEKDTLYFKVENEPPVIRDFIVEKDREEDGEKDKELVTPTKVKLKIIGATDLDGQIKKYRWWYYPEGSDSLRLGVHTTAASETEMIIVAQGEVGVKNKYFFGAEVIDNDNGVLDLTERYGELTAVEVINGPNVSPVAEFTADKTTISAGDSITFISEAYDPQGGELTKEAFQWDFDGDGAFDDTATGPEVSHEYNTPGDYQVRLRVMNRGLSSSVSLPVYVQPTNSYPQASFSYSIVENTVTFNGKNSAPDKDLDSKTLSYEWDFDTQEDADGNGVNDDDVQSTEAEPKFDYKQAKQYRVRLKVKDATGMEGVSVRDVDLNVTSADRAQRVRQSLRLKATAQPITLLDVSVSPYQLEKGSTADILAVVQNADGSTYKGQVFFELLDGTGTFSPTPTTAVDSKAETVFTAVDAGDNRIRVTATDTFYGDLTEELIINVR